MVARKVSACRAPWALIKSPTFTSARGDVFPDACERGVFVHRHNLRLLVAGALDGDFELVDGGDFSSYPGLAKGGAGVAHLLGVDVENKNRSYCFGLGIDQSAGHQHISHVYVAGLDGLTIFHQASIGAVKNLVVVSFVGADGEAVGCGGGHCSANSIPFAKNLAHAVAAVRADPMAPPGPTKRGAAIIGCPQSHK